jgi:hypothetical protein
MRHARMDEDRTRYLIDFWRSQFDGLLNLKLPSLEGGSFTAFRKAAFSVLAKEVPGVKNAEIWAAYKAALDELVREFQAKLDDWVREEQDAERITLSGDHDANR